MAAKIKLCFVLLVFISSVLLAGAAAASPQETTSPAIKLVRSQYQENGSRAFIPKILGLNNTELQAKINTNLEAAQKLTGRTAQALTATTEEGK